MSGCRRRGGWVVAIVFVGSSVTAAATSAVGAASPPLDRGASAARQAERLNPPRRSLTVAATGDVLTENAVLATASAAGPAAGVRYDFGSVLDPITPIVAAADLAICHMELPIGSAGERAGVFGRSPFGGNLLLAPAEVAVGLRDAGFDRCSTASNHSNDLGVGGISSTLDRLDEVGVSHVGTARTPAENIDTIFAVEGVRVAHLSYTRYSNTNRPADPWRLNFPGSARSVINDVATVRAAGAEIVIVSVHVSVELLPAPTAVDRAFVTAITAAGGVDLVIEHGPHVVQPVEQVNGTWVFWSVGNLISGMGQPGATRYGPPTLDGLLGWMQFSETTPGHFDGTPTAVLLCSEISSRIVRPAVDAVSDMTLSARIRAEMQACIDRSRPIVPGLR